MELDRQPWPEQGGPGARRPQRVPETRPTPLQDWFIYLSVIVLVCGFVAITALEMGAQLGEPIVRLPVLIGSAVLVVVSIDALVRIWRSAWAWMPIDRGRGLFRLVWTAVVGASVLAAIGLFMLMLLA